MFRGTLSSEESDRVIAMRKKYGPMPDDEVSRLCLAELDRLIEDMDRLIVVASRPAEEDGERWDGLS